MERQYTFTYSAQATEYIIALFNQRPRGESNPLATAMEQSRAQQDAEYDRQQQKAPQIGQPEETWERVTNGEDRTGQAPRKGNGL
jgi:hypothetical protein